MDSAFCTLPSALYPWLLAALSLAGTWLNVRRDRRSFLFWIVANCGWIGHNAARADYAQAVLFSVFLSLALWGWFAWSDVAQPPPAVKRAKIGVYTASVAPPPLRDCAILRSNPPPAIFCPECPHYNHCAIPSRHYHVKGPPP